MTGDQLALDVVRIVLIDDHVLVRDGVRQILQTTDDLTVVGEAGNGPDGLARVAETRPDLVLLDVEMPGPGVLEMTRRLRAVHPPVRVVVLSMYDDPALLADLVRLGIRGYFLKSISRSELVSNLRALYADDSRLLLSVSPQSLVGSGSPDPAAALTAREREVLVLTADALTNAQIAARLNLTEATVKRHLRNVFAKLGAVSRIDAVNKAVAARLIPR